MPYDQQELRKRKLQRWASLQRLREPWVARWSEVTRYLLPFGGRYFTSDTNTPKASAFNSIYDETPLHALYALTSGLMAGMTNPARPWFRLATVDYDLMEYQGVKLWLEQVTDRMRFVFARSNLYRVLPVVYEELAAFGTAVMYVLPDVKYGIWATPLTAGEYALACDGRGLVNTVYREFEMPVSELVDEFVRKPDGTMDWSVVSTTVKKLYDSPGTRDDPVKLLHVLEPRYQDERVPGVITGVNKPWRSMYLELNAESDKVLRESGFDEPPGLGCRWSVRGRDVYGVAPSFAALGSIKQLQHQQLRKGQAIDFLARPPVLLPADMRGQEIDALPGGVSYYPPGGSGRATNLYDVRLDLNALLGDIQDVRQRINKAFYADIFLSITNDMRLARPTAREVMERHEEKLLMLGPVLERLHNELLAPLTDRTFLYLLEGGHLPPPPRELEGEDIKIEFVSVLAQAQRAVGLESMDRLIGTIAALAGNSGDPSVWDKLDKDQLIDEYAERLAIDPSLIVADENVVMVRAERARAAQEQQQAQEAIASAKPALDLANAAAKMKESGMGALTESADMMRQLTGL